MKEFPKFMHGATTAEIPLWYVPVICYVDGISAVLKLLDRWKFHCYAV